MTKVAAEACAKLEASPDALQKKKEDMTKLKEYMRKLEAMHETNKDAVSNTHKGAAQKIQQEEENFDVVIGNSYCYLRKRDRILRNDPHRFACFVKVSAPEKVEKVEFKLHHEFGAPNPVVVKSPPFIMDERDAYDTFIATATIVLKSDFEFRKAEKGETSEKVPWMVVFDGVGGQSKSQRFKIGPRRAVNSQSKDKGYGKGKS